MLVSVTSGQHLHHALTNHLPGDVSLLVSLFRVSDDGKFTIDFPNQRVWITIWQVANVVALLGLIAALCWYLLALGAWAMLYEPIHFAVFLIICFLIPLLIYISYVLVGFYIYLKEAYIEVRDYDSWPSPPLQSVLGQGAEEEEEGLTREHRASLSHGDH